MTTPCFIVTGYNNVRIYDVGKIRAEARKHFDAHVVLVTEKKQPIDEQAADQVIEVSFSPPAREAGAAAIRHQLEQAGLRPIGILPFSDRGVPMGAHLAAHYGLPGAASVGVVTTFLSDNPAVLSLAQDRYFKSLFKAYQFPALTNLGTSFGMGFIVCTYMISLSPGKGVNYTGAALTGLLGAVVGSIVSTRIMLAFTAKVYGREQPMIDGGTLSLGGKRVRPVRAGGTGTRFMSALLDGGMDGVKMGVSIIPGVLVICTVVMMLTNGPAESGLYTGAAYEGIGLLPKLADKLSFILTPLFGFSSPEGLAVPVTALGAAGAAISLVPQLLAEGKAAGGDIAVFTAMCMCWSGYLSTHVSMMNSLGCNHLIGKAIISHTVGGLCAGVAAHWLYVLFALL